MRAVLLTGYGDVGKLELQDVPEPVAGPGELKVRMLSSSVNPVDWKLRSGAYRQRTPLELPVILGRDASGEVVAVGEGSRGLQVGAKVIGLVDHAFAEYVVASENAWAELPAELDPVDAGALPLVVLTGAQLIEEAVRPRPGEVVLVTGAVGSVGRAAVFAARERGAEVIAAVRAQQREEAAKLKVDVVALDDATELQRLPRLDAIADTVGGDALAKLIPKVKPGGTIGSVLGEPAGARERGLAVRAHFTHPDSKRLAALARAAAEKRLAIPIARRMPLAEIRAAQTLAERGAGGKIVVRIG
ncbi:MAG: NADP-dependent oxidoreductase [Gammaproteobacteria bacterium]|nr:NADP-dependent oxidoreductase [Gammaproteobacteria bacterium]MBV8402775.1 NADP-dependent oxidoreductase [Gammaproteobacteria bacterium]